MNNNEPIKDNSKQFVYENNIDKPIKVMFAEATIKENDDYTFTVQQTKAIINIEVPDKEYSLQHTNRGWRCISWHPHYIMTDWVKSKDQALLDGDNAIIEFYDRMKKSGEALRIVYDRMMKEKEDNENILP